MLETCRNAGRCFTSACRTSRIPSASVAQSNQPSTEHSAQTPARRHALDASLPKVLTSRDARRTENHGHSHRGTSGSTSQEARPRGGKGGMTISAPCVRKAKYPKPKRPPRPPLILPSAPSPPPPQRLRHHRSCLSRAGTLRGDDETPIPTTYPLLRGRRSDTTWPASCIRSTPDLLDGSQQGWDLASDVGVIQSLPGRSWNAASDIDRFEAQRGKEGAGCRSGVQAG